MGNLIDSKSVLIILIVVLAFAVAAIAGYCCGIYALLWVGFAVSAPLVIRNFKLQEVNEINYSLVAASLALGYLMSRNLPDTVALACCVYLLLFVVCTVCVPRMPDLVLPVVFGMVGLAGAYYMSEPLIFVPAGAYCFIRLTLALVRSRIGKFGLAVANLAVSYFASSTFTDYVFAGLSGDQRFFYQLILCCCFFYVFGPIVTLIYAVAKESAPLIAKRAFAVFFWN